MARIHGLLAELEHEARTTRRHLERLPEDHFDWRPHPKSSTAGQLASHLVDCVRWTTSIFAADELDLDASPHRPFLATTSAALLDAFDEAAERAAEAMANARDVEATGAWRLEMRGTVWFERPRESAFRDMTLNHLVHHRGQLSVYVRLLGIAVPASYGPTADDG